MRSESGLFKQDCATAFIFRDDFFDPGLAFADGFLFRDSCKEGVGDGVRGGQSGRSSKPGQDDLSISILALTGSMPSCDLFNDGFGDGVGTSSEGCFALALSEGSEAFIGEKLIPGQGEDGGDASDSLSPALLNVQDDFLTRGAPEVSSMSPSASIGWSLTCSLKLAVDNNRLPAGDSAGSSACDGWPPAAEHLTPLGEAE